MRHLLCASVLALTACPFHNPFPKHYTDETGLVGVTVPDGSMAGTFAMEIYWSTVVTLPLIGDQNGGSQGFRLLTRTWDASRRKYQDSFKWCRNDVFAVEDTTSNVDENSISHLATVSYESDVDHEQGRFQSNVILNIWGAHNLPNGFDTDLPTHDNYTTPPNSDYVLDEDEDGHPGVTAHLTGNITGEAYVISRSVYTMDGAVLSTDHLQGLARSQKSEQHTVDGSSRLVVGESKVRPDPDPTQSWFDMVRIPDGSTCADVMAAYDDGRLAHSRPFPK